MSHIGDLNLIALRGRLGLPEETMKIAFVLGAGASVEAGYPTGNQLCKNILNFLSAHTSAAYQRLIAIGNTEAQIEDFKRCLYRSAYSTIDQLIAARRKTDHIRIIGKQMIAMAIGENENVDRLYGDNLNGHWYNSFLTFLRTNPLSLSHKDVSFITFNYDRSLEFFIYEALDAGHDSHEAFPPKELLSNTNCIHLHGKIGYLPWQLSNERDLVIRDYGAPIIPEDIVKLAQNILTPDDELSIDNRLRGILFDADCVLIMGFGFHEPNLSRIFFDELVKARGEKLYITTHGLGAEKLGMLQGLQPALRLLQLPCRNFFDEFARAAKTNSIEQFGETLESIERRRLKNLASMTASLESLHKSGVAGVRPS